MADPLSYRNEFYQKREAHESETRREASSQTEEINQLKSKRQQLREAAAASAGLLGLQYDPSANNFVRITNATTEQVATREILNGPEPIPEPMPSFESHYPRTENLSALTPDESKSRFRSLGLEIALWIIVLPVAAFVGIGLATIAGFQWRNDTAILTIAICLGFAVVSGLKLLFSLVWAIAGKERGLGNKHWSQTALATVVTVGGCALDAHLGAMALVQYSLGATFRAEDATPYAVAYPIAMVLTAPLLLASAAHSWKKGNASPSIEERENARIARMQSEFDRRHREELEMAQRARQTKNEIDAKFWERQIEYRAHQHAQAQKARDEAFAAQSALQAIQEEEWNALRNHPEFKCLQGLISQISVLSLEIDERTQELKNYKISRGYQQSGKFGFSNGKSGGANGAAESEQSDLQIDGAEHVSGDVKSNPSLL